MPRGALCRAGMGCKQSESAAVGITVIKLVYVRSDTLLTE